MPSITVVPMRALLLLLAALVPLLGNPAPTLAGGGDWPQFGGPKRAFHAAADEKVSAITRADGEARVVWHRDIGSGYAGPAVADGTVFVFHRVADEAVVEALALADGTPRWRFQYATDYSGTLDTDEGPRATPTVADGNVIVFGAEGVLHCLDAATGAVVWRLDTRTDWPSDPGFFGRACAPLVADGTVVLQLGCVAREAGLIGIDAATGKVKWQATDHEAGYAAPVLAEIGGRRLALCLTREALVCLDPRTGAIAVEKRFRSTMHASVNAASPVVLDNDRIFLSACYGVGAAVWQLAPDTGGITPVWAAQDALDCHYNTPVRVDGDLYGFHGRQEQGQELRRVRAADATVVWKSPRLPAGSVTRVGDQLLVLTELGELIRLPAGTDTFAPAERVQILGAGIRAYPAVAGGRFLARDRKRLVCVAIAD